jgi:hypothetical protein
MYVLRRVLNAAGIEVVSCDVKIEYLAQTFVSFVPPVTPTTRSYPRCRVEVRTLDVIGTHVKSTFYHTEVQRNCVLPVPSSAFISCSCHPFSGNVYRLSFRELELSWLFMAIYCNEFLSPTIPIVGNIRVFPAFRRLSVPPSSGNDEF